ncbi:SH3 domain-containing kinase-binding protein 1 isoform X2 [Rhinatrema bivittatum]|uniref:SH3 domain-containing kinase-binding protein 1 isoform X2 n=1 Tax=Rhinatrema bivittatum TaxID=194408 RepID=UPI00112DD8F5|nr:SH3 domain-containing kinase-binding protein 1 isoform X2 [Rhinatrema bivittatum]
MKPSRYTHVKVRGEGNNYLDTLVLFVILTSKLKPLVCCVLCTDSAHLITVDRRNGVCQLKQQASICGILYTDSTGFLQIGLCRSMIKRKIVNRLQANWSQVDAIVEFDYQAQHEDELTIAAGDIITNIKKEDGGWWEGEAKGRRGLFPDNFVRELKRDVKKESPVMKAPEKPPSEVSNGSPMLSADAVLRTSQKGDKNRRRRCQVAFSYMPQNEDELELKVGEIIEVLGEVEEGWWEGILNGKTGMFPSNFIKELQDESDSVGIALEEQQMKLGLKDMAGSESDGGDSSSTKSEGANETSSSEIQPKKIKGYGFGDIFKDKPIKLRPRSIEVENDILLVEKTVGKKLPPTMATQEPVKIEADGRARAKEYCKVLFPYEAQNEDELTIKEGEIITIVKKDCLDVGWWLGEVNGRRGVFPDNFVKLLPPDFEKEVNRPKKPPPLAPVIKPGTGTEKRQEIKKIPPERPESLPNRGDEKDRPERDQKLADVPRPSIPAIPPKKPRPPKTSSLSRPGTLPPRRPERPAAPLIHTSCRSDSPKAELIGNTPERDSSDKSNDVDLEGFDSVVSAGEKLNHPTASRPKASGRRPPSQSFTSSSLSSPDFLDSPSPEEEKEEFTSLSQKPTDVSKKVTRTVTVSQVSENRASLPQKAGGGSPHAAASSSSPSPAFHSVTIGTTGHRSNTPSLLSTTEGKTKTEHGSHGQLALDELRTQVKELRSIVETMKDQQKKEIKQLLTELDEEKKIRLRLQMEVNEIKKTLQSK